MFLRGRGFLRHMGLFVVIQMVIVAQAGEAKAASPEPGVKARQNVETNTPLKVGVDAGKPKKINVVGLDDLDDVTEDATAIAPVELEPKPGIVSISADTVIKKAAGSGSQAEANADTANIKALTIEGMVVPPSSEVAKTLEEAVRNILVQAKKQIGTVSSNGIERLTMPYQQLGDGKSYEIEWRKVLRCLLVPVGYNFTEDGDIVLLGLAEEVDAKHRVLPQERLAANHTPILFDTRGAEGGMTLKDAIRDVAVKADVTITTDYMEPEDLYDSVQDTMSKGVLTAEDLLRAKSLGKQSKVKPTAFDTKGKLTEWRVVLGEILNPHGYGFDEVDGIVRIAKFSKFALCRSQAVVDDALAVERLQTKVARTARFMRLCRAAERGDEQAQLDVGLCFCAGDGVWCDFDKAIEWYRKAAATHDAKKHLDWDWVDCLPRNAVACADIKHCKAKQERLAANRTPILFATNESEGGMTLKDAIRDVAVKADVTITTDYMEPEDSYDSAKGLMSKGVAAAEDLSRAKSLVKQSNVKRTMFDTNGQQIEWRIVLMEILGPFDYYFIEVRGIVRIAKWERIQQWESDRWERGKNSLRNELLLYPAAVRGNAAAQFSIGLCYADGVAYGQAKDLHAAAGWWLKAAEQGNAEAQYRLGDCYLKGEGVGKDAAETVRWWREAAGRNHVDAQLRLGICYAQGDGVETNAAEAVRWWLKAAELGNAPACFRLGLCHERGEGVAMDAHEAEKWYRKAAEMGNVDAKARLWDIQHEASDMSMSMIGGVAVALFVILMVVTFLGKVRSKRGRQCGDSLSRRVKDNKVQDESCAAHGQMEEGV